MLKLISNSVLASEIAEFLNAPLYGNELAVYGPTNLKNLKNNSVLYIDNILEFKKVDFTQFDEVLILSNFELDINNNYSFIIVEKPSIELIRVLENFFTISIENQIHQTAIVEKGAKLGKNVLLSSGCRIGSDVQIGDNTIIWENTVIKGKVKIGSECVIKSNSTIGSDIFNFILDNDQWIQFPQIGEIIIEDNVWIGANSTIEKGTVDNTIIKKGTRIDDLVQIGSNCIIGESSIIAAGTIISRDVVIGKNCWIAPNVSIRDRIFIGDNVTVGIGAVVVNNIEFSLIVVGNPAKILKQKVEGEI